MVWGFIRIVIFITAFLVGLLLMRSAHSSANFVVTLPSSEHAASKSQCGEGNFVLADAQDRVSSTVHASGM
jgi:hypothetical protein